jgi:hypothetical protein
LLPKALSDDIFDFGSCNSLFFEFNSPVRPEKFPVPVCREFGFKRLNFIAESPAKIADSDQNRQNSLLFSLLAGNFVAETGSTVTASATTQSCANGDFPVQCE